VITPAYGPGSAAAHERAARAAGAAFRRLTLPRLSLDVDTVEALHRAGAVDAGLRHWAAAVPSGADSR
jgi:2-phospho-L-lactate guanylyltransferase (CobY/MobA/RfbA family)